MKNRKLGGPSGQEQEDNKRLSNISNRIDRVKRIKTGEELVNTSHVLPQGVENLAFHYYNQHKVVIPSVSFTVGSNHKMLTNMKQKTLNKHIRKLIEFDIYETVKNQLSLGTSIQLQNLDTANNVFIYSIVKSNTPPSISFTSMDDVDISHDHSIIEVEPLSMSSNTNMHVHPAIEKHLLPCGQAMYSLLESRGLIHNVHNAERVGPNQSHSGSGGLYQQVEKRRGGRINILKTGWAKRFLKRLVKYPKGVDLRIIFDYERLDYETDMALQVIFDKFIQDMKNDPEVPSYIKRLVCEIIHDRGGGRFGGKTVIMGKAIEHAEQKKNNESQPAEYGQYDDNRFYEMKDKVVEACEAVNPIVSPIAKRTKSKSARTAKRAKYSKSQSIFQVSSSKPIVCCQSWAVAPHPDPSREDLLFLKPLISAYITGVGGDGSNIEDAYDGPALSGNNLTLEERYSDDFGWKSKRTMNAKAKIIQLIKDKDVYVKLLDRNRTACRLADTTLDTMIDENSSYKMGADIFGGEIKLLTDDDPSALLTHSPVCRSGDCRDFATLNVNAQGCMNVDAHRNMLLMCQGKPIECRMPAIEASMAQRLFIDGLGQYCLMKGLLVREYLAPELMPFDKYGGNKHGRITHYPLYPMATNNKAVYTRRM